MYGSSFQPIGGETKGIVLYQGLHQNEGTFVPKETYRLVPLRSRRIYIPLEAEVTEETPAIDAINSIDIYRQHGRNAVHAQGFVVPLSEIVRRLSNNFANTILAQQIPEGLAANYAPWYGKVTEQRRGLATMVFRHDESYTDLPNIQQFTFVHAEKFPAELDMLVRQNWQYPSG